ncbi:MAG: DUF1616 domain-containing protein [Thermoplasmata archaeon]
MAEPSLMTSSAGVPDPVSRIYDAKLLIVASLVCAFYLVVELAVGGLAQVLLGLFVILVAPGYAVGALFFGRGSRLPWTVQVAVIVGLSVVIESSVGILYFVRPHGGLTLNLLLGLLAYTLTLAATVVQWSRGMALDLSPLWERLRSGVTLPGFSRGQRVAAFALFAAILLTFGAIGYLSTVHPGGQPVLSIAAFGPNGTTNTLPTGGNPNQTLEVIVEIGNDGTPQSLNLTVSSALSTSNGTSQATIAWTMPLALGPGSQSSTSVPLAAGEIEMIPITFEFASPGDYTVTFTLLATGSTPPVDVALGETIR